MADRQRELAAAGLGIGRIQSIGVWMCVFFFQAEDGIRDYKVTGVQTCALPISGGTGMIYFLLTLIRLLPLFFLHSIGFALPIVCIAGIAISLYFVFSGVLSLRSGWQPVTSKDVYQWRHKARLALFRQAQGDLPPGYTFM